MNTVCSSLSNTIVGNKLKFKLICSARNSNLYLRFFQEINKTDEENLQKFVFIQ